MPVDYCYSKISKSYASNCRKRERTFRKHRKCKGDIRLFKNLHRRNGQWWANEKILALPSHWRRVSSSENQWKSSRGDFIGDLNTKR